MSRRAALLAALVVTACVLAPAGGASATTPCALSAAQQGESVSGAFVVYGGNPGTSAREWSAPAQICGAVVVSFHGDPAVGCAAMGVCGISGQAGYDGDGAAQLLATIVGRGPHAKVAGVAFGEDQTTGETALVTRTAPDGSVHTCSDTGPSTGSSLSLSGTLLATQLDALPDDLTLGVRCAAPARSDIAAALPSPTVALSGLIAKGGVVDMSGSEPFAGHGFSGTVTSTLSLAIGRKSPSSATGSSSQGPLPKAVFARYGITGVGGTLSAHFAGPADPGECAVLDACGLSSDVVLSAPAATGTASFDAFALGRGRTPAQRMAHAGTVLGQLDIATGFTLAATASWPDQAQPCTDSLGGLGLQASASSSGGHVVVALFPEQQDIFRSRCPGPFAGDFAASRPLELGSFPARSLGAPSLTVHLERQSTATADDGYTATVTPDLTLKLRRRSIGAE